MIEYVIGMAKQMQNKFSSMELQELISMSFIFLKEQELNYPEKNGALKYTNARWKLFNYCKAFIKDNNTVFPKENIVEIADKKTEDINSWYSRSQLKEMIMKVDMQNNLSSDALYAIAGILNYEYLKKPIDCKYKLSKKMIIIYNLQRDKNWKRTRAKNAVDEITKWWENYFHTRCKRIIRKEGEVVTYYRNGKAFKKIKKNGKMLCLKKEDNSVN